MNFHDIMHNIYRGQDKGVYDLSRFREFMSNLEAESVYSQEGNGENYSVKRRVEIFHVPGISLKYVAWCELQYTPVTRFPDFYNVEVNAYGKEKEIRGLEEKLKEENRRILSVKNA